MLKLQYFGHLIWRTDSLEKTLILGKTEGRRRRGRQRMRWLDGITNSMDMSLSKLWEWWWTGKPGVLQSMGSQRVGHNRATELNWWLPLRSQSLTWSQGHVNLPEGQYLNFISPGAHFQIWCWLKGDDAHSGLAHCVVTAWRYWAVCYLLHVIEGSQWSAWHRLIKGDRQQMILDK